MAALIQYWEKHIGWGNFIRTDLSQDGRLPDHVMCMS
jgi:hypothetical protein